MVKYYNCAQDYVSLLENQFDINFDCVVKFEYAHSKMLPIPFQNGIIMSYVWMCSSVNVFMYSSIKHVKNESINFSHNNLWLYFD